MIEGTGSGIRIRVLLGSEFDLEKIKDPVCPERLDPVNIRPASSPNDRPAAGQMEVTLLILIYMHLKGVKKKSVLFVFCSNNAYFLVNIIFNIFIEYILHV